MNPTRCAFAIVLLLIGPMFGCATYPIRADIGIHERMDLEFSESVQWSGFTTVEVETRNGFVEVVCEPDRKSMEIEGRKFAKGITFEDAREHAEMIEIETGPAPGDPKTFRIAAHLPMAEPGRSWGADFCIAMPSGVVLDLKSSNGRVSATGAGEAVRARTSNGSVTVVDAKGSVRARSSNGRIVIRNVIGDIDADTSNKSIDLENVEASSIRAITTNGRIRAVEVCGRIDLRSSNGSIDLRTVSVPEAGHVNARTSNGHIDVTLPHDVKADLRMGTSNGRVRVDLKGARVDGIETDRNRFAATLNGGGGLVELRSSNGSVTFHTAGAGGS